MPARVATHRAVDLLFVLALASYVIAGREVTPFHGDESTLVWMSRDAHTLIARADPGALAFDENTREPLAQWLRVLNGSLTPLAIGFTWQAAGFERSDLNQPWVWVLPKRSPDAQWSWNLANGRRPSDQLLGWARWPSTIATAASVAAVFALAWAFTRDRLAAWVATAFYATQPAVLINGRRAMQEGGLLLAVVLVMGAALWWLRARERNGGIVGPAIALATTAGLAVAAKHSAGLAAGAAGAAVAVAPWLSGARPDPRDVLRHFAALAAASLGALALFTALVPVWWFPARTLALAGMAAGVASLAFAIPTRAVWALRGGCALLLLASFVAAPSWIPTSADHLEHLVNERRALVAEQTSNVPPAKRSRPARLLHQAFFANAEVFEDPAWANVPEVSAAADAYRASPWAGRSGAWRWPSGTLLALLVAVGTATLLRRLREPSHALLLSWTLATVVVLLASPLPWQRYALPLHAPLAILAGFGTSWIARQVRSSARTDRATP